MKLVLAVVALVWCFCFAFLLNFPGEILLHGDEFTYWTAAREIYSTFTPSDSRPLFIALIHGFPMVFGISDLASVTSFVIILNLLLWLTTILLIYKLTAEQLGNKSALLIGLSFVFCVGYLAACFKFLSESTFIFMLVLSIFYIGKFIKSQNHDFLSAGFGILLLSIIVKPLAIGLILIFVAFFFKSLFQLAKNKYSLIGLVALLLIFYQINSMHRKYGNFTIGYIDSFTYYNHLGAKADCLAKGIKYRQCNGARYDAFIKLDNSEQKKMAQQDLIDQLSHNFPNLAKAYALNLVSNAFGGSFIIDNASAKSGWGKKALFRISRFQNMMFTFIGIFISLVNLFRFRKTDSFNLLLTFFFVYIWLISGISAHQGDRFSIVFFALVLLQLVFCSYKWKNQRPFFWEFDYEKIK